MNRSAAAKSAWKNTVKACRKTKAEAGKAKRKFAASKAGKKGKKTFVDWKGFLIEILVWTIVLHVAYAIYTNYAEPQTGVAVPHDFWWYLFIGTLLAFLTSKKAKGSVRSKTLDKLSGGLIVNLTFVVMLLIYWIDVTYAYAWYGQQPINNTESFLIGVLVTMCVIGTIKKGTGDSSKSARSSTPMALEFAKKHLLTAIVVFIALGCIYGGSGFEHIALLPTLHQVVEFLVDRVQYTD